MSRFARNRRVFFFEEPIWEAGEPRLIQTVSDGGVNVLTPVLPPDLPPRTVDTFNRQSLLSLLSDQQITSYIAWYYTPMAMEFTSVLDPALTVYDCMDELSAFAGAPPSLTLNEAALFQQADLVFTGGASLFASKRKQHDSVHQFASSIDTNHFSKALSFETEPADQAAISHPRLGYAGVIDERMDVQLLTEVARARPEWQFVLLGPIVKIDPLSLPKLPNIHLLGMKSYADLPQYFSGWDIGLLPFALNDATKYISPTKTPEYLAAGLPVISTAIRDVVSPYGELGFVRIVSGPGEFISAAEEVLDSLAGPGSRTEVDRFLAKSSWDKTWQEMEHLMKDKFEARQKTPGEKTLSGTSLRNSMKDAI